MLTSSNPRYRKGPVGTVRYLLLGSDVSSGFYRLKKAGKLEWTVEAVILQSKYKPLFTDQQLAKARIAAARKNQTKCAMLVRDNLDLAQLQAGGHGSILNARPNDKKLHRAGCETVGAMVSSTYPKVFFEESAEAKDWLDANYGQSG